MNIRDLFTEERAVSPVIGVILMVAVAVVIAAAIGSTVLGIGNSVSETAPQASFNIEQGEYTVTDAEGDQKTVTAVNITLTNGDDIKTENLDVTIDGKQAYSIVSPGDPQYTIYPNIAGSDHPQVTNPFDRRGETISVGETTTILGRTYYLENNDISLADDRTTYSYPPASDTLIEVTSNDITVDDFEADRGETLRIIWSASEDSSRTLYKYDIE